MPERPHKITAESARLGRELRALRTLAKLPQHVIATALGVSKATVGRAEAGEQWLSRDQVRRWAEYAEAGNEVARRVVALAEAMHGATWSDALAAEPVPHLQGVAARRDAGARLTRIYEIGAVPGLLQTVEYAHAVIPQMDPTGQIDHAAAEAARVDRREVLFRGSGRFEFVLGESALRWSPAAGVMPAQFDRLIELARLPTVDLAVLPADRVGTPHWQSFIYREPADDSPPYVTQELLFAGPVHDDPDIVTLFRSHWAQVRDAALHGDRALDFIRVLGRGGPT